MTMQERVFDIMVNASFNEFDGEYVVKRLKAHNNCWKAVLFARDSEYSPLITLRDLADDSYNADTLFILPKEGKEQACEFLANSLGADEVSWIGGEKACSLLGHYSQEGKENARQILRVWFD